MEDDTEIRKELKAQVRIINLSEKGWVYPASVKCYFRPHLRGAGAMAYRNTGQDSKRTIGLVRYSPERGVLAVFIETKYIRANRLRNS